MSNVHRFNQVSVNLNSLNGEEFYHLMSTTYERLQHVVGEIAVLEAYGQAMRYVASTTPEFGHPLTSLDIPQTRVLEIGE